MLMLLSLIFYSLIDDRMLDIFDKDLELISVVALFKPMVEKPK